MQDDGRMREPRRRRLARIRWRLRKVMAEREVWTGAELGRLMSERAGVALSSASLSALVSKQPSQVKLDTLAALCIALRCTPNELLEVDLDEAQATSPDKV
jgi:putative transcriptional regulator